MICVLIFVTENVQRGQKALQRQPDGTSGHRNARRAARLEQLIEEN